MDKNEFETKLNEYLQKESLVLTPVNVSFTFDIDVKDAAKLMEELTSDKKLEKISGEGSAATYKLIGKPMATATPGEKSVAPAKSSSAFYHALTNFFIPGLGSLIYLKPAGFVPVLILIALSVVLIIFLNDWFKLFAVISLIFAWIWSVVIGIIYYAKDPWSTK
jgi:hypothetical protein